MFVRSSLLATLLLVSCADPPAPVSPAQKPVSVQVAPEEAISTSDLVPVSADDPMIGPKNARVTIVLWSDFQCPFCARVEPTLAHLRDDFGKDLRIVWKDNPLKFHKFARVAAVGGRVIFDLRGADAFLRFHVTVVAHQ
jgi:protein-disulfide isomerase